MFQKWGLSHVGDVEGVKRNKKYHLAIFLAIINELLVINY